MPGFRLQQNACFHGLLAKGEAEMGRPIHSDHFPAVHAVASENECFALFLQEIAEGRTDNQRCAQAAIVL